MSYSQPTAEDYAVVFQPEKKLEEGSMYTVGELIERMIIYSDNPSKNILVGDIFRNIKNKSTDVVSVYGYSNIFEALVLSSPDTANHVMRAKEVAAFFRVLFNAFYLNRKYSEKSLELLSRTSFNKGMTRLMPTNIQSLINLEKLNLVLKGSFTIVELSIIQSTPICYVS